ncbi:MAG: 2-oxoacid:acceptor oxidoreductase subunit alpha [Candidatus Aenigmarchaeota archaeon]|nr:2-oxoacid:acceptor oxidoreductase subunit alpha [Candidatus Aenigmarchaeota archaeon]
MKKTVNKFSWKIGGEAGDGILNAGLMLFAKSCLRGGLYVFATAEYPSLIRGGHNNLDLRIEDKDIFSHVKQVDMLVALNKETVDKHSHKLVSGSGIIYDGDELKLDKNQFDVDVKLYPIPLMKFANECGGKIMRNTVALGGTIALLDFDLELMSSVIRDHFGAKKGTLVAEQNIKAAKLGYDYIKNNFPDDFAFKMERLENKGRMFMSGNEAISTGAVKAGCKFFAAYPMTPASSILSTLAAQEKNYNIVVKHTEDEIAAINMAIGASFAGARAMTATSGGGFALMTEGLGLAAQTETPLVVVEAQRPGPATGMATHSGQGDLRFVLHASTDEFPRIVMAPGDVEECFHLTIDAFNLADKYQMPVIILTDKYLGESYKTVDGLASKTSIDRGDIATEEELSTGGYKRYKITESGVSPRSIPGQRNGMFVASSYEHDEEGYEREEEEVRIVMHDKRYRKFQHAAKEVSSRSVKIHGNGTADFSIISWGSPKGPILEAMKMLEKEGINVNYIQVVYLSPFPEARIKELMKKFRTIVVENNKTSQLSGLIKEHTGLDTDYKILKYDGRPFSPEDIYSGVKNIILDNNVKRLVFSREGVVEELTEKEVQTSDD